MSQLEQSCQEDPKYITYLLSPDVKHDTYFLVGKVEIERIGAVRKMLAAHSVILRNELEDSDIAEKGEVIVNDLFPTTFKNLLRFVYGYNNISSLTFEEADDLLYASDKYFLDELKNQVVLRLMVLLDSQNVCSLLNNPVCHSVLELNAKITEILQMETKEVFASPQFLDVRTEGFIKILEQDCLNVPEIKLFKNALTWAKNKVMCEDGNQLREEIEKLKHIRIRTISLQDFLRDIVPSGILSSDEVIQSCILYGKDEKPPVIQGFSNKTYPRFHSKCISLSVPIYRTCQVKSVSLEINTKCTVGLLPLEIQANSHSSSSPGCYRCVCNVEITNESDKDSPPVTIHFDELVTCGKIFKIALENSGLFFTLSPNASYKINLLFNESHTVNIASTSYFASNEICLKSLTHSPNYGSSYGCFPFKSLNYVKSF